jgi:hypothetical protein
MSLCEECIHAPPGDPTGRTATMKSFIKMDAHHIPITNATMRMRNGLLAEMALPAHPCFIHRSDCRKVFAEANG